MASLISQQLRTPALEKWTLARLQWALRQRACGWLDSLFCSHRNMQLFDSSRHWGSWSATSSYLVDKQSHGIAADRRPAT